jgi:hypothetical protein
MSVGEWEIACANLVKERDALRVKLQEVETRLRHYITSYDRVHKILTDDSDESGYDAALRVVARAERYGQFITEVATLQVMTRTGYLAELIEKARSVLESEIRFEVACRFAENILKAAHPFIRQQADERIAALEDALVYLTDQHHRTITGSRSHAPDGRDWPQCPCTTCDKIRRLIPERAKEALYAYRDERRDGGERSLV